jgi:hypothetical protein
MAQRFNSTNLATNREANLADILKANREAILKANLEAYLADKLLATGSIEQQPSAKSASA